MPRANKLTDVQLILLANASQRAEGSLMPPPDTLTDEADRVRKGVASLIKREYAAEVEVADVASAWRSDGDRHIGAVITEFGRVHLGVEPHAGDDANLAQQRSDIASQPAALERAGGSSAPKAGTKQALVVDLLQRNSGATLIELATATGWLPHTTRAALTGLRKRGHAIAVDKADGTTRYRIGAAA